MTISLKHKFTSGKADGGDATLVRPSNWNDEHDLVMAADRLLGRTTAGTGVAEEITVGTGLTLSTGSIQVTPNTYQPLDAELTALAGLVSAADQAPYFTGSGTASLMTVTTAGRAILDDATAADQRTTLGLGDASTPTFTSIELGGAGVVDTTITRSSAGVIAVEGVTIPRNAITETYTAGTIELGHASDTTLSRSAAGILAVEGNLVPSPASQATGDVLYRAASNWARLAAVATGNALISGGVGTAPSWGKIGLTTHISGTLPIANGGTNSTATPTNGGVAYGTGSAFAFSGAGTSGQFLKSNGAAAPTWAAAPGWTLLGTINTTSGSSQALSSLTLTSYKMLVLMWDQVTTGITGNRRFNDGTDNYVVANTIASGSNSYFDAMTQISLVTGAFISVGLRTTTANSYGSGSSDSGTASGSQVLFGVCRYTTATTTVTVNTSGTFSAGSVKVYGVT